MKRFKLLFSLAAAVACNFAAAETILPNLEGDALVSELRQKYRPQNVQTYSGARQKMFAQIDNRNGKVELCYTGVEFETNTIPNGNVVNTEHTWPQSRFEGAAGREKIKADLHHLFPTESSVNSRRGNNPFAEIPDTQTQFWYHSRLPQSGIPEASVRDQFSEATEDLFEPREAHKGNAARALFYVYTIYGDQQISKSWFLPQVSTLLKWNQEDAPDQREQERNQKVSQVQGNLNPFIVDPGLAKRVFGSLVSATPQAAAETIARAVRARNVDDGDDANEESKRLRIGAWNIENLGTRAGDSSSSNQEPNDLAEYIISSKVDVLSLEEIHDDDQSNSNDPGRAPWRNDVIEKTLALIEERTGHPWKYALTEPSAQNERRQMTGVAWNTDSIRLLARRLLGVKGGELAGADIWTRVPEAFHFSAGQGLTDFVLIPLHMKSNRTVNGANVGMDARKVEAAQLDDVLGALVEAWNDETDIVLLGDTNMLAGEQTAAVAWGNEFKDLNASEQFTYIKPFRNDPFPPFDRIFVPIGQPEFVNSKQVVHGPFGDTSEQRRAWRAQHLKLRSDHLLVWTDIVVGSDDDQQN